MTQIDPAAVSRPRGSSPGASRRWLGAEDTAESTDLGGHVEPPSKEVREEMLRLELAAIDAEIEAKQQAAEAEKILPDDEVRGGQALLTSDARAPARAGAVVPPRAGASRRRPGAQRGHEPAVHAGRGLVDGDPVGRRSRRARDASSSSRRPPGPPPEPPLARLGPALAGGLSGLILEDAGRLQIRLGHVVPPDDPERPWRCPAIVRAAFRWEPARAATMRPNELATEVLTAFRRAVEGLGKR